MKSLFKKFVIFNIATPILLFLLFVALPLLPIIIFTLFGRLIVYLLIATGVISFALAKYYLFGYLTSSDSKRSSALKKMTKFYLLFGTVVIMYYTIYGLQNFIGMCLGIQCERWVFGVGPSYDIIDMISGNAR